MRTNACSISPYYKCTMTGHGSAVKSLGVTGVPVLTTRLTISNPTTNAYRPPTAGRRIAAGLARLAVAPTLVLMMCCGPAPSSNPTESYTIATGPRPTQVFLDARTQGILAGQVNGDGTACLWIGAGANQIALFWPYGYTARGNPLAVYDDVGKRVATVGQRVALGGARAPGTLHSILGCSSDFNRFWTVGEVVITK